MMDINLNEASISQWPFLSFKKIMWHILEYFHPDILYLPLDGSTNCGCACFLSPPNDRSKMRVTQFPKKNILIPTPQILSNID